MEPIYVTGHQNPDTDSIVAAIAYASLRNALGDKEYTAACLGRVSDETQLVLNHFGFEPPTLITNVYTQVQDLDFDKPPILNAGVTVDRAWNELQERKELRAIPVANDDGTLLGLISREDIASYKCCCSKYQLTITERIFYSFCHICTSQIMNNNFWTTLCF